MLQAETGCQCSNSDNEPEVKPEHHDGTCNYMHPCAFAASENSDNTLHYGEMIKMHDRENFQDMMETEIDGLNKSAIFNI